MKIIILVLFLSIKVVFAEGNLSSQKIDICKLREVVSKGWTESNQTLNNYIIEQGEVEIPRIISLLYTPLVVGNKEEIYSIPKFMLTRDDYTKLLSYSKYLESQGNIQEVSSLYIKVFKGLNNEVDNSLISLMYKIVINNIVLESLRKSIEQNFFPLSISKSLKNDLAAFLITDNDLLLKSLDNEKTVLIKITQAIKLDKSPSLVDESLLMHYKNYLIASIDREYSSVTKAIINNTLDEFEKKKQNAREEHYQVHNALMIWLLKQKIKFYNFLSIRNNEKDYSAIAKYMVDNEMLVNTPSLNMMYQDYFDMVEANKKLLEELDK